MQKKYNKLMRAYYKLSKVNRQDADNLYAEAQELLKEIDRLD